MMFGESLSHQAELQQGTGNSEQASSSQTDQRRTEESRTSQPTAETPTTESDAKESEEQSTTSEASASSAEAPVPSSSASASTESPAEAPEAGTSDQAESSESSPSPEESAPASEETRRRPRLNPTVDPKEVKPVPTYSVGTSASPSASSTPSTPDSEEVSPAAGATTGEGESVPTASTGESSEPPVPQQEAAETAEQSPEEERSVAQAEAAQSAESVDVPPTEDLDADLEAEIAAALSQDEQQQVVAQPVSTGSEDSAEEAVPVTEDSIEQGTRLKGKIQSLHGDNVFLDFGAGFRSPGLLQRRQLHSAKDPEIGQEVTVTVDKVDPDEGVITVSLPRGRRRISGNWDSVSTGQVVDCMVTKTNKGGLEVSISNLRGFLPAGHVDVGYVSDLEPYVGQKLTVQIIEVNPQKRNLVVSRRAYLEVERKEAEEHLWKSLEVGQTFPGTVKTIKDYGAFIDIGGVDGFLHIGEISWTRINHPSEVIQEGQQVDVKVISLDPEKKRIGLGMRQLTQNPWANVTDKYAPGKTVSGKVTRTADFGAFVELEAGVEGLVHISELDYRRVHRVTEVLNVGQEIDVQVLEVDPSRKRISLSVKALKPAPASPEEKTSDENLAPSAGETYSRKRKGPLKGGIGGETPGGLFGNPKDFT